MTVQGNVTLHPVDALDITTNLKQFAALQLIMTVQVLSVSCDRNMPRLKILP